jgi:hypothetical protein
MNSKPSRQCRLPFSHRRSDIRWTDVLGPVLKVREQALAVEDPVELLLHAAVRDQGGERAEIAVDGAGVLQREHGFDLGTCRACRSRTSFCSD